MPAFVIVGRTATSDDRFSLDDLPGTSGRLDVLLRCIRAALLVSHGVRRDVRLYLVLLGGTRAPRVVRFRGDEAKFLRPDERPLATLVRKVLAFEGDDASFVDVRPGIALAHGGLATALDDLPGAPIVVLDETGTDIEAVRLPAHGVFVLGDHLGLDEDARAILAARGAAPVALGPVSVHSDDAVAIVAHRLDRNA